MAELMQPNIVGNFLNAYQSGLERQEAQKAAERQRMRQDRSDQMSEQRFQFDMDAGQLDMALRRGAAMNEILAGVDERNPQTLEIAKQRYLTTFGGKPEDVAQITMADIPRIKLQTGQTLKELELRFKQAQIGTEQEQGRAARALASQRYAAASGGGGNAPSGATSPQGAPAAPQQLRPLSAQEQSAVIKNDETANAAKSALVSIEQAIALSPKAAAGLGSQTLAPIFSLVEEPARAMGMTNSTRASDTVQFDAIVKENILPQLKIIFGGNPTEGEREILLEISGSSSMGYTAREALLKRMRSAIQRRLESAQSISNAIRNRTYFLPNQPATTASAPTPPPAPRTAAPSGNTAVKPGSPAAGKTKRGVSYTVLGD
jgi:hypothetical protein